MSEIEVKGEEQSTKETTMSELAAEEKTGEKLQDSAKKVSDKVKEGAKKVSAKVKDTQKKLEANSVFMDCLWTFLLIMIILITAKAVIAGSYLQLLVGAAITSYVYTTKLR